MSDPCADQPQADVRAIIRSPLELDSRQRNGFGEGSWGSDIMLSSGQQLFCNDRLHPSVELFDDADFETRPVPFSCEVWRLGRQPAGDRLQHATPLLRVECLILESWALDILHSWYLGPLPRYEAYVLWFILRSNCFGVALPWLSTDDIQHLNMSQVRYKLTASYKRRASEEPGGAKKCIHTLGSYIGDVWSRVGIAISNKS